MLKERSIMEDWVKRTLDQPDETENREDGTRHFLKMISENDNRWLRVIVNVTVSPETGVTAFFDRRLRRGQ